ncbi:ESCRT-III subunit protein did4 [Dimargaris cristalligena]|uniref:Charged multivesicular body protein 2a-like protein n=1 Tax=Dimargaris cristalligena TaxID=215637 RepID=A0A4P9ZR86_9FUNG|nr:ESCRT-III subunit protein did4 [Dimargaris cristalligena]RKP35668.1 charged multivesicular body protein 2a-like protein [Dimargaris cristalligena]|eukprot:RKP35668.1 charged multivesicular body protein 2a-like protein [Dimargaris cristalligena]
MLDLFFGKRKSPAEQMRIHQRSLNKAVRELDRERVKLEQQEKKLIADIKKTARNNQMGAVKIMARDLVRTRKYVQKFYQMRTQLQAVALRIQALRSNQQMGEAMRGATKAMKSMNGQMNLPGLQKIMMEFEKESEMMDMKGEIMNDTIDDVMEDDMGDDEEESEAVVSQVLDEIGISVNQSLADTPNSLAAPTGVGAQERTAEAEMVGSDAALQARLDNLRRE